LRAAEERGALGPVEFVPFAYSSEIGVNRATGREVFCADRIPQRLRRRSDNLILPRKGIALLGLLLAASLCSAQDQPKTGKNVQPAVLIHYVKPDYPDAWKREGIQGTVHLHAIITKEGNLQNVTVIDGDARLAKSAEKAVKKWRYKPTAANGEPVDVETTLAITFALNPVQ
jgi:protein TonB